jgi:hypothetical protein
VTDNSNWQPPEPPVPPRHRDAPPPGDGRPGASFPPPGASFPPPGGSFPQPGGAVPPRAAWTPPPKAGLIPLRPLDLGTILGASFRVLRRNPKPTFGVALLVQGVSSLISLGLVAAVVFSSLSRVGLAGESDAETITVGSVAAIILTSVASVLFTLAATAALQGIIVLEVARGTLGEKLTLRQLWRRARGRLGALIGWSFLVSGLILAAVAILSLIVVLLASTLGTAGIAIGVLLGIFGGLGLVGLGIWIGTKVSLVPSVLMVERLTLRQAVARSWTLTGGSFWRVFGIQFLVSAMISIALQVISAPLSFLAPMLGFLLDPNAQGQANIGLAIGIGLLATIVTIAFGAIGAVVQSAATALIYLDLRIRREGLDLELARFVEAKQSGDRAVPDPYLASQLAGAGVRQHYSAPAPTTGPERPSSGPPPWA